MTFKNILLLTSCVLICQAAGGIGAISTTEVIPTWYATLNKPFFNPPSWLFGPVWTLLYTLMGISLYKIRKHKHLVIFFGIHLVLNTMWSIIFFGWKNPGLALGEIILLWSTILYMIIRFRRIDKLASNLLIPYLCWVSFATLLNAAIWQLN